MNTTDQVIQIVADYFNQPTSSINPNSSTDNVDAWDSLAQVNLMIALEQTFDIELEVEDFLELTSVDAMASYIDSNT